MCISFYFYFLLLICTLFLRSQQSLKQYETAEMFQMIDFLASVHVNSKKCTLHCVKDLQELLEPICSHSEQTHLVKHLVEAGGGGCCLSEHMSLVTFGLGSHYCFNDCTFNKICRLHDDATELHVFPSVYMWDLKGLCAYLCTFTGTRVPGGKP